ncbi:MAG: HAD family hydrolase [Candidatus Parvarchaeota archaeon]|nr:HAD family hydrolase [Candidatus Parvarchaeota archaeon]MCW1301521.1 HAD family hydrolase [Candidatus Parvarchaeota archaeon]
MIKGIASDLDGTLLDSTELIARAWEEALSSEGLPADYYGILKRTKGISSKDIIKMYKENAGPEDIKRIKDKRRKNFLRLLEDRRDILYPETINVIRKVKERGIKFAIATGLSRDLLDHVLDVTGLSSIVDCSISADDVSRGKPEPDIFLEAFRRLNVDPKEGLVIGDSENDIIPGKKIGAFTVFISREGGKLDIADADISNLEELFKFL